MAEIKKIKIGTTVYDLGGGDSVSFSRNLSSGTKIGTLTINSTTYDLYCETVPTDISAFTNDSGYITNSALTNYYTKSEVNSLISDFGGFEVVSTLPAQDIKTNIIYLLGPIGTGADKYEEWIYDAASSPATWIKIGETSVDLSNYYTKSEVDTALGGKQDTIDVSNPLPASNVSGLATVATTGSYSDLSGTPTTFSVSYDSVNETLVFTQN